MQSLQLLMIMGSNKVIQLLYRNRFHQELQSHLSLPRTIGCDAYRFIGWLMSGSNQSQIVVCICLRTLAHFHYIFETSSCAKAIEKLARRTLKKTTYISWSWRNKLATLVIMQGLILFASAIEEEGNDLLELIYCSLNRHQVSLPSTAFHQAFHGKSAPTIGHHCYQYNLQCTSENKMTIFRKSIRSDSLLSLQGSSVFIWDSLIIHSCLLLLNTCSIVDFAPFKFFPALRSTQFCALTLCGLSNSVLW